jgi:hypothetical protein
VIAADSADALEQQDIGVLPGRLKHAGVQLPQVVSGQP